MRICDVFGAGDILSYSLKYISMDWQNKTFCMSDIRRLKNEFLKVGIVMSLLEHLLFLRGFFNPKIRILYFSSIGGFAKPVKIIKSILL